MNKSSKLLSIVFGLILIVTMVTACTETPEVTSDAPEATEAQQGEDTSTEETEEQVTVDTDKPAFDEFPRPRIVVGRPLRLVFITHPMESEARERTLKQVQIEAEHYGWELTVMEVADASEYKDAFLSAINLDVDAIHVGNLQSMQSITDVIAQARNAGIGVYNDDNEVVPGIIGNSTMPNAVASLSLIYKIGEDYGWKSNIVYPSIPVMQVHQERLLPLLALAECYPSWTTLEVTDVTSWPGGPQAGINEIPSVWMDKFGDELDGIFCTADGGCTAAAEVAMARGLTDEDIWMAGIDGGSDAFAYIRNNTPFMYDYAQAFEAYAHFTNEMIIDIQIEGLNPGDPGCIISKVGEAIYTEGVIVTRENVPDVGVSIHTIYDYWDDEATDVWYKWETSEGIYLISEGGVQE